MSLVSNEEHSKGEHMKQVNHLEKRKPVTVGELADISARLDAFELIADGNASTLSFSDIEELELLEQRLSSSISSTPRRLALADSL